MCALFLVGCGESRDRNLRADVLRESCALLVRNFLEDRLALLVVNCVTNGLELLLDSGLKDGVAGLLVGCLTFLIMHDLVGGLAGRGRGIGRGRGMGMDIGGVADRCRRDQNQDQNLNEK